MMRMTRTLSDDDKPPYHSRPIRPKHLGYGSPRGTLGFSSKSGQGVWSELSEPVISRLSRSVVSIASFFGNKRFYRTGICIQTSCPNVTSFLTSASLFSRIPDGEEVKIQVLLPGNRTVPGRIQHGDVYFGYAVVSIEHVPGFHATHLDHDIPFEAFRKVVAVWRSFRTGLLLATSGVELGSPAVEPYKIMLSTCDIDTAGIGGPLVDYEGNFVGMNRDLDEREMTPFLKRVLICELLGNYGIVSMGRNQNIDGTREGSTSEIQKSSTPGSSSIRVGPRFINSFEDAFDGDVWSELPDKTASRISRSVVSLASFDGDTTFFTCTGFVLYCHTSSAYILTSASLVRVSGDAEQINTGLRIEVCLPDGFRVIGRLKAKNFTFNLACIEILGHWDLLALKLHPKSMQKKRKEHQPESSVGHDMTVIAVGCLFDRFSIMATRGLKLMNCPSKLECSELHVSTCKITKAGVGGPLIDMGGNFVGMNFYHDEGAHFLKTYYLCPLLRYMGLGKCFKQDKCVHDFSPCDKNYRWPLAKPNPYGWPTMKRKPIHVRYKTLEDTLARTKKLTTDCHRPSQVHMSGH